MSERWDAVGDGGDDAEGWRSRRTAAPSRSSLRRHSQPRNAPHDPEPAPPRVPGGRRPDPSSLDPDLTALRAPLSADDPRRAPAPLFPLDGDDVVLQPGIRLRVGPRHGTGQRREAERRSATPLGAALGAMSEVGVVLGMALLLSLLIKTFLVQAFFIPSPSMENTLLVGDRVLVSKLSPGVLDLSRGDIVVFKDPGGWLSAEQIEPDRGQGVGATVRRTLSFVGLLPQDSGEHLIKRVVGVGGDRVVCCDKNQRVTVNGTPIDETPYLAPGARPSAKPFDVTVPRGYLWVMGDNRPVSADSRAHGDLNKGMVPVGDVVGKAFVVVWPFDRAGGLGVPETVFARVPGAP